MLSILALKFFVEVQLIHSSVLASMSKSERKMLEIKIERDWPVRYSSEEWDYLYLKPLKDISAHYFINKRDGIKLVLQNELRWDDEKQASKLIKKVCDESGQFLSANKSGFGELKLLNGKSYCYLETVLKNGHKVGQFLYPKITQNNSYSLYSYGWRYQGASDLSVVTRFMENL